MNPDKISLFAGINILIFGLGKSGIACLKKLSGKCRSIIVLDDNPGYMLADDLKDLPGSKNIKFILGNNEYPVNQVLEGINLIIISPGISMNLPIIKSALKKKISIWGELEFAWYLMNEEQKKNTIAITGTNGKTTVTTLIGKILNDSGHHAITCGNIGNPLIATLDTGSFLSEPQNNGIENIDNIIRVIEVSSFQLENIHTFCPHIAIILNITNDHIDRHISMAAYSGIKFKISKNQGLEDFLIINSDDKQINKALSRLTRKEYIKSNIIKFSLDQSKPADILYSNGKIRYSFNSMSGEIPVNGMNLVGNHNISNIMSAVAAAKLFDMDDISITGTVKNFTPLPHRLEFIGIVKGVKCFNDSKATNPDAVIKALEYFGKEVTLILGGLDKGMDFKSLIPEVKKKVLNLILIGSSKELLYKIFSDIPHEYKIFKASTLEDAVSIAMDITEAGNTFLLSPACASMDMFKDYKDRGDQFKKIVLSQTK